MSSARRVEREWLDELPAADPRAMGSRRDLRLVNALMSNASIVAAPLREGTAGLRRIAEIGAGDGAFALSLARALPRPAAPAQLVLLDRQPVIDGAIERELVALGWRVQWRRADVFDWLKSPDAAGCGAIVANLFLHHFEDAPLAELLRLVESRAPLFVACEPARSRLGLIGSRMLGLLGCNDVTRHDAVASVRAGFRGDDLTRLWPRASAHVLHEGPRGLFSHAFVARAS